MEIRSRYGEIWKLEETDDGYKFVLPPFSRIGFEDNGDLTFVDPPGGPFISIGSILGDKKIVSIKDMNDYVILKTEEA